MQFGVFQVLTDTTWPAVDAYIAVRLPDGRFLSLTAQGGAVPGIVPIASRFTPFPLTAEIARYTFGAGDPPGGYTWFAALTEPATATVIGAIDMDPFTLGP